MLTYMCVHDKLMLEPINNLASEHAVMVHVYTIHILCYCVLYVGDVFCFPPLFSFLSV